MGQDRKPWLPFLVPPGLVAVTAALFEYVAPFVVAGLVAVLVDPWVEMAVRRWGWRRPAGVLLVVGLGLIAAAGVALVTVAQLAHELSDLAAKAPGWASRVQGWADAALLSADPYVARLPEPVREALRRSLDGWLVGLLGEVQQAVSLVRRIPGGLFAAFVTCFSAYFFVRDKHGLSRALLDPFPGEVRRMARSVWRRMAAGVFGFLRAQMIIMTVTATGSVALFSLVGVPYPWVLGTVAGFFDVLPVVGPGAVFIPLIAARLAAGATKTALHLVAGWGALLVVRQTVEPRLMGAHMGLHPLTAVAAVYLGGRMVGLSGFVLGPMAAVFLKAAYASLPFRCGGNPS